MSELEPALEGYVLADPWLHARDETPTYGPDYELLSKLLTLPTKAGAVSESGAFAKATDLWLSMELRRAGFTDEEVWPRPAMPRVLPADVAKLVAKLPKNPPGYRGLRDEVTRRVVDLADITPADARILGRAYDKQVDVCISRWKTGPELLVSTKTQVSSFGKNLPNRFEEALGDAANLRERHPLAATGYLFVQRSTILDDEPDAFERTKDMVRKLQETTETRGYTATALVLVAWDHTAADPVVTIDNDPVPTDLQAGPFLRRLIEQVLTVTPVTYHTRVRERYERRELDVPDETDEQASDEETDTPTLDQFLTDDAGPTEPLAAESPPPTSFER
ncbi:hypothetical protein [Nitriliruptor alkaliphilus]|uniref:hypothetical protein n=1 Tax=Nitriliruptor alkaliphilus TaxID=427918 RepID=UPI001B80BF39|nr:hypothetical protein [Nitriliruptor alkaliphilus]